MAALKEISSRLKNKLAGFRVVVALFVVVVNYLCS